MVKRGFDVVFSPGSVSRGMVAALPGSAVQMDSYEASVYMLNQAQESILLSPQLSYCKIY